MVAKHEIEIIDLKRRADMHDSYFVKCDSDHAQHYKHHEVYAQFRREYDDKMKGVYSILTEMRDMMKEYKESQPIITRSKNFFDFIDKMMIWFGISSKIGKVIVGTILTTAAVFAALKTFGGILL
jgi:hypothetical protein